jgi:hypothetical protein
MSRYPPEKLDEGAPVRPYETWTTHLGKKMSGHRCHGKSKRSQLQCDRRAALGQDVCKMHGGGSPQALEKGRERIAAETAHATAQRTLAQPDAVRDPLTALANIAGEVLALNEFLHAQVDELNGTITYWTDSSFSDAEGILRTTAVENVRAVLGAYERSLDRGVKVLATMVKLDLQGRLVTLREQESDALRDAILKGLGDVDMPQALRDGVQAAIAARLEAVTGPAPVALPA